MPVVQNQEVQSIGMPSHDIGPSCARQPVRVSILDFLDRNPAVIRICEISSIVGDYGADHRVVGCTGGELPLNSLMLLRWFMCPSPPSQANRQGDEQRNPHHCNPQAVRLRAHLRASCTGRRDARLRQCFQRERQIVRRVKPLCRALLHAAIHHSLQPGRRTRDDL